MDTVNISDCVEAWLANNEGRVNSMLMQIQTGTDDCLEIYIDGTILQIAIPHNFYTSCSSDGIISNSNCAFVVTLKNAKSDESHSKDTVLELITDLNEKLDRMSSRGFYSFSSVLDSILNAFEKYKSSTGSDGAASEIDEKDEEEEDGWSSDDEAYGMTPGTTPSTSVVPNKRSLINGYLGQLIEDANKKCDGARSSTKAEVPCNENIKDDILRWCNVYSSSDSNWCVKFEIQLSGILSECYRHQHGHVFEALGFSFATPLLIEVIFEQPLGINFNSTSLDAQGESLSGAFLELSAMHAERPLCNKRTFVYNECDVPDDIDQQLAKEIILNKSNPMYKYGLRSLLPRIAKGFFSRGGRDPDNNNGLLLACEDNIFVRFLLFTGSHLASLLKRCIVCDKELPFTVSRLCSCANELCLFGFEVLGLGAQVLQELNRMPLELIDLEISLALTAANGYRDVFEPFPPFLLEKREIRQRSDVLNNSHFANPKADLNSNNTQNNKNMVALRGIINSFPSVSEMRLCANEVDLKAKLAKSWLSTTEGKLAQDLGDEYFRKEVWQLPYNVLRFILCTNRQSLVFLSHDDDKILKLDNSINSQCFQFAVVQDSPEREALYTSRNKQEVSIFGFHGSRNENWYSILRNGLQCFSNTKLMSTGNIMGDGIYLANNFYESAGYAENNDPRMNGGFRDRGNNDRWMNRLYKHGFHVVSICEVISSLSIKEGPGGVLIVPKEEEGNVAVRYLLVYDNATRNKIPRATISDGHILWNGNDSVDLSEHYQSIRQKYVYHSGSQ